VGKYRVDVGSRRLGEACMAVEQATAGGGMARAASLAGVGGFYRLAAARVAECGKAARRAS
jgi:hypothetical protein